MNKIAIYYFSGTGNSLHVAKEFCKLVPETDLIPIIGTMQNDRVESNADIVGIVFPIHAFGLPSLVRNFLKKIDLSSSSYIFAIATRGGSPSIAFEDINRIMRRKGKELDSYFYVQMANNSIIFHGLDTLEEINAKEEQFINELTFIEKIVMNREKSCNKDPELNYFNEKAFFPIMNHIIMPAFGDKIFAFKAASNCNGCGMCEKVCLSNKIVIKDGAPKWTKKQKCTYCFACINFCPARAIQIKRTKTSESGRYHHSEINAVEIARQKQ